MNLQRNWGGRTLAVKAKQKCVHIFGNEGRSEMWNYRSFAVKAEGKCGCGTSHIWQWRLSVSGEADLQIFGSQDWAKVQKRNCKSLEVQAEMKCGSGNSHLWKSWQNNCVKRNFRFFPVKAERKQNFRYLAVKAERKCGSGTSHFWQSSQNKRADVELQIFGSKDTAEAELQIFGSQDRADVRKRNIRSLAVKAEQKWGSRISAVKTERNCGSSTADLWQSSQAGPAEADLNIFDRPYPTDCHCQCWRITLLTAILKDNVKIMYGLNTWLSQCAWQGQYAPARALGNTVLNHLLGPSCRVKKSPSTPRIGPLGSFVPAVFSRDVCLMSGSLSYVSWFDHAW